MCGIAGVVGDGADLRLTRAALEAQSYRGPDDRDDRQVGPAALGHLRLSILDLSSAGRQPMTSADGRLHLVFNGEVYNYLELRAELDYPFRTGTDSEVILAAYRQWGDRCVERFRGMFAFAIWDEAKGRLFCARDRFGVKPFFHHQRPDGTLLFSSEIKGLHAMGVPAEPDPVTWATYLASGYYDHSTRTFFEGVSTLRAGHTLVWQDGRVTIRPWFDLGSHVGDEDERPDDVVMDELVALMDDALRLRLRSDVPIGINLSGGLDSSLLLELVRRALGPAADLHTFTYVTGDERYDELPWVERLLAGTAHKLHACLTTPEEVPALAERIYDVEDEPYGGLPVITLSRCFARARELGVIAILDGQGLDEQWAGYDYYRRAAERVDSSRGWVQGTKRVSGEPTVLTPEFSRLAEPFEMPRPTASPLVNLQLQDAMFTKIPRAVRFNDRVSMMHSVELREPFLDERLFELALRQPARRKIQGDTGKWFLRRLADRLLPREHVQAPKRPVQTPQREWLRGPLAPWVDEQLDHARSGFARDWLDHAALDAAWRGYRHEGGDNSFHVWQWTSIGLAQESLRRRRATQQAQAQARAQAISASSSTSSQL